MLLTLRNAQAIVIGEINDDYRDHLTLGEAHALARNMAV